jgi:hypothetical protein
VTKFNTALSDRLPIAFLTAGRMPMLGRRATKTQFASANNHFPRRPLRGLATAGRERASLGKAVDTPPPP